MIRFGLCCIFAEEDIKFRKTTAASLSKLTLKEQREKVSDLCLYNAISLLKSVIKINDLKIKSFRITSPLFPLYTHPEMGYKFNELNSYNEIANIFSKIKKFKEENNLRLSFHPDQFIVLCSPNIKVVENSIAELDYQAMISEYINADVLNLHVGGAYGDKAEAINRFEKNFHILPERVKCRLTIENDDKIYTPSEVYNLCRKIERPLIYDVHHHRCNPDNLTISEATELCIKSWKEKGEPYFHISSPKLGWQSSKPQPHADYIDVNDFPAEWLKLKENFTVDVEAKMKEKAVLKLKENLRL